MGKTFESDHDRPEKALDCYKKSLEYYEKAGDPDHLAHATRHLADVKRRLGKTEESEQHYEEAIRLYRNTPETGAGNLANALRGYGLVLEDSKKVKKAMEVWEEARRLYQRCRIKEGVDEATERLDALRAL